MTRRLRRLLAVLRDFSATQIELHARLLRPPTPGSSSAGRVRSTRGSSLRCHDKRSVRCPRLDSVSGMSTQELQTTLVEIERRGWDSLCASTGAAFYGDVMTEDAVMVLANGAVMDRDAVVDALGQAPPWRTYDISDVRVVDTGPDSATLVYVGAAYREGDQPAFVGVMSSVYVRRDSRWRLAVFQQTQMPVDSA